MYAASYPSSTSASAYSGRFSLKRFDVKTPLPPWALAILGPDALTVRTHTPPLRCCSRFLHLR